MEGAVEVFDGHRALFRPLSSPAVALGNFDGVHIGHQRLFARAVELAAARDGDAVVYTFEPHPAAVLAPELAPPLITTRARKLELMAACGIDVCVIEPFTRELAVQAPDQFLADVITGTLHAQDVVVGYDFTYGKKRAGTTETLRAFGDAHGFATHVIPQVTVDGLVASSTKVRDFALQGKLGGVRMLLGRDYDVDGVVVKGAGRGRTIGIPTANLAVPERQLLPQPGVYAVRAHLLEADQEVLGVANLGTNPTFVKAGSLSLEVHLFDFDHDIYDQSVRVAFIERIRGERRFDGPDALVAQIRDDIDSAKRILQGESR